MRALIKRLNWRQILIHFSAIWLFIHSFQLSSYLIDLHLFKMIIPGNKPDLMQALKDQTVSWDEVKTYIFLVSSFWFYGLLLGFLISLITSIKRHWFWLNAIIPSCGAYFIYRMPFHGKYPAGWHTTNYSYDIPTSIFWYATVAILCLAIGLWMFFSRRMNRFIAESD